LSVDSGLGGTYAFTGGGPQWQVPSMPSFNDAGMGFDSFPSGIFDLMDLGMTESPPPFETIEELHHAFFSRQAAFIPVVHPGRYLKAFHSAPHLRPPMCLQYAIWAMAALGHETYDGSHDVFYRRARQYLDADEMKSHGEVFITVSHAQAWGLIATYEARCMYFTRASMSSARCVRLCQMMGLHRLDNPTNEGEPAPVLTPPQDWTELEERRRVLWGCFCIDSHASISTGWPTLIDPSQVTTHLPSSEDAFNQGKEEKSCPLNEAFQGASYSSFASTAVLCHKFHQILKHIQKQRKEDRPEDFEYGKFWQRHRELDTTLSSSFMFLPEHFRLPKHLRDPFAVQTNLNLHASVICLHHAALDVAERHSFRAQVIRTISDRLTASANEIVNIMKMANGLSNQGYASFALERS